MDLSKIISNLSLWMKLSFLISSIVFVVLYFILNYSWILSILVSITLNYLVSLYLIYSNNSCSHSSREFGSDSKRSWEVCSSCQTVLNVEVQE